MIDSKTRKLTFKKNQCCVCDKKTYRAQASVPLCSFCEQQYAISFDGARKLIRRTDGEVVATMKGFDTKVIRDLSK